MKQEKVICYEFPSTNGFPTPGSSSLPNALRAAAEAIERGFDCSRPRFVVNVLSDYTDEDGWSVLVYCSVLEQEEIP